MIHMKTHLDIAKKDHFNRNVTQTKSSQNKGIQLEDNRPGNWMNSGSYPIKEERYRAPG
jgi:hypothetical protein